MFSKGLAKEVRNAGEIHIWVKECKNLPLIRATIDPYVKWYVETIKEKVMHFGKYCLHYKYEATSRSQLAQFNKDWLGKGETARCFPFIYSLYAELS